jgi:hypothetical protein
VVDIAKEGAKEVFAVIVAASNSTNSKEWWITDWRTETRRLRQLREPPHVRGEKP